MSAMNYRRLGGSGLKVSGLSFGSWVTYGNQLGGELARQCMAAAFDAGDRYYEWLAVRLSNRAQIAVVKRLAPIAADLGCTLAQMSLAWRLKNPHASTVITGASRPAQVRENMKALDVAPKLTPEIMARIEAALAGN